MPATGTTSRDGSILTARTILQRSGATTTRTVPWGGEVTDFHSRTITTQNPTHIERSYDSEELEKDGFITEISP